jgi:hypothetical protein
MIMLDTDLGVQKASHIFLKWQVILEPILLDSNSFIEIPSAQKRVGPC